jgi:8-hydroxy-5-deazaflavin:NADPH oxidoreductase
MRIGVLGTGTVGRTIATKLVELGHDVRMGSRTAGNEAATEWCATLGERASEGTFADAAGFGELVLNCTNGNGAIPAVTSASAELAGKLLVDVCNPLDFSGGGPSLSVGITDSIGEQVQRALPDTAVVKALNTVNCDVMVTPGLVPGEHQVFVCGNDADAKARTTELLGWFGWPAERVIDVGDITGARATEGYLLLWLRLTGWADGARFNIEVHRAE